MSAAQGRYAVSFLQDPRRRGSSTFTVTRHKKLLLGRVFESHRPDIALYGKYTSRRHAEVRVDERGRVVVRDLGSANGTAFVSDGDANAEADPVSKDDWREWTPGTRLRFGIVGEGVKADTFEEQVAAGGCDIATLRDLLPPVARADLAPAEPAEPVAGEGSNPPRPRSRSRSSASSSPSGTFMPGISDARAAPAAKAGRGDDPPRSTAEAVPRGSPRAASARAIGPELPPVYEGPAGPPRGEKRPSLSEEFGPAKRPSLDGSKAARKGAPVGGATASSKPPTCDKCDGPHTTDRCPNFKNGRESHKDAWVNYGRKHPLTLGKSGSRFILPKGRVMRQPGDGSCLFHSLCHGLRSSLRQHADAHSLRRQIADFIAKHPSLEISGDTLEEWVKWDTQTSVKAYTNRMAVGGWGGGIEMVACSILKEVNVHVYEIRRAGGFERISCFDCPKQTNRTIHVLYVGGMHFDALVPG